MVCESDGRFSGRSTIRGRGELASVHREWDEDGGGVIFQWWWKKDKKNENEPQWLIS